MMKFHPLTLLPIVIIISSLVLFIQCDKNTADVPAPATQHTLTDTFRDQISEADLRRPLIRSNQTMFTIDDYLNRFRGWGDRAQQLLVPDVKQHKRNLNNEISQRALLFYAEEMKLGKSPSVNRKVEQAERKALIDRLEDLYIKSPSQPTPEEIRAHYDANVEKRYSIPAQIKLSQILVKTEAEAQSILNELRNGSDFKTLAQNKSLDKRSAPRGGALGWIRRDMTQYAEIIPAGFALQNKGELSEPVETKNGYAILRLEDKREAKVTPFERAKRRIERELRTEKEETKRAEMMNRWIAEMNVTIDDGLLKVDDIRQIEDEAKLAVIAGVDTIYGSEFNRSYRPIGAKDTYENRRSYLIHLLEEPLMETVARKKKLQNDAWVQRQVRAAYEQAMVQEARRTALQTADLKISDEELHEFYEKNRLQIRARHILVDTEAEAQDLMTQLSGGADFAELAKTYSQDPGSGQRGGDLGFFSWGMMVAPFQEMAFSLEEGEISPPVKTQFGYHLIKVEERRHVELEPFEKMETTLRSRLAQIKSNQFINNFVEDLKSKYDLALDDENIRVFADYCAKFQSRQQQALTQGKGE
ncbi:MAG: hypothetical protein D6675_04995 [Gemmatimonadetes bacterium]|nr:MAG: hypothetical protein D6675_04995 [Gemmatimonadota bacterium]